MSAAGMAICKHDVRPTQAEQLRQTLQLRSQQLFRLFRSWCNLRCSIRLSNCLQKVLNCEACTSMDAVQD